MSGWFYVNRTHLHTGYITLLIVNMCKSYPWVGSQILWRREKCVLWDYLLSVINHMGGFKQQFLLYFLVLIASTFLS